MKDYSGRDNYFLKKKKSLFSKKLFLIVLFFILGILIFLLNSFFTNSKTYEFINPFVGESKIKENKEVEEFKIEGLELLINKIEKLTKDKQGLYGLYVKSMNDGFGFGINEERVFTAASINKLPIVASYLIGQETGKFSFSEIYKLKSSDIEDGSGTLINQKSGSNYTYDELLKFIGRYSDNTATNVLVEKIGVGEVEKNLVLWKMFGTSIINNKTTPKDTALFLEKIYKDEIFKKTKTKDYFFDLFVDTEFEERIPAGIPDNIIISHKIGNQVRVWSDCGMVFSEKPYSICILTDEISEAEAKLIVPQISKYVWEYEGGIL